MLLRQIWSDKFIENGKMRPPINFVDGLNVVQGTDIGSNSIGKSSFLLAIDFAFGGRDYATQGTLIKEVGIHTVYFCFEFNKQLFFYSRSTGDIEKVNICNPNYETIKTITLDEFTNELLSRYGIKLPKTSFRDIVGRYFRIYRGKDGKDNLNEKRPLDVVPQEKSKHSIIALLKLYNHYSAIAEISEKVDIESEKKTTFSKAQDYYFLTRINATEYKSNLNRLEVLKAELEQLATSGDLEYNTSIDQANEVAIYQAKLTNLKRQKSRFWSQWHAIKNSLDISRPVTEQDLQILREYFPTVNLREIVSVEVFHRELSNILSQESKMAQQRLISEINVVENQIKQIEEQIKETNIPHNIRRALLEAFANKKAQILAIEEQNRLYLEQEKIRKELKALNEQLDIICTTQVTSVQAEINKKMAELNDIIYNKQKKPPVLNIDKLNNYVFFSPDDDGTGTNYKNLIVFDLSSLALTPLPALIHDTVVFKHIADLPIEKIIQLYVQIKGQVFIAFDRLPTYTEATQKIIDTSTKLRLYENGGELYGRAWNKTDNN